MAFFESCSDEQLLALKAVQKFSGVTLKDKNPYSAEFDSTPSGQAVRVALEANHPDVAAHFKSTAEGFAQSLDAELFNRGKVELTEGIHSELMDTDAIYRQQFAARQQAEEERLLADMTAKADALAKSRGVTAGSENQKYNPHLGGSKFRSYFEGLNAEAALNAQD